jgi:ADP-ribose pyrophosphatase
MVGAAHNSERLAMPTDKPSRRVLAPWTVLSRKEVFAAPPYVSVSVETVELPDGRRIDDYYQLTTADFVCVFAETEAGGILMLRQYKHGARQVSLTFPAGHIAPGEAPETAARRELVEETGYEAAEWRSLGQYVVNANHRNALAHFFRATGCRRVGEPDSGDLEEMELLELSRAELVAAIRAGKMVILSNLALAALALNPLLGEG